VYDTSIEHCGLQQCHGEIATATNPFSRPWIQFSDRMNRIDRVRRIILSSTLIGCGFHCGSGVVLSAWSAQGGPSASTTFEAVQSWLVSTHQQKRPGRHLAYALEALRWQSGASLKSAWCGWSLRQMCDGRTPAPGSCDPGASHVPGSEETGGGPPATSIIDDPLGGFMKSGCDVAVRNLGYGRTRSAQSGSA
jgi:hypothetical protein